MLMIETQGLRKTFKVRRNEVQAVGGVEIQVQQGEIFGFLGPNGAGKSTTMRMLATLLEPTSGRAIVAGYDLMTQPARIRTKIGYVGQAGGAENSSTGHENVMLQARLYGLSRQEAHQRTMTLIEALQLTEFASRPARTYSGGQRRRLDLAMGMVHQPALLFLDEPTTGLDPQSRAHLWEEVRKLRANGTTIFLTTHYLEEADALCDRLAIIDGGTIVAEGTPQALKQQIAGDIITLGLEAEQTPQAHRLLSVQPFTREVEAIDNVIRLYVERGEETLPKVLRLLDDAGLAIRTVTLARPTLDDVFLRQTGHTLRDSVG